MLCVLSHLLTSLEEMVSDYLKRIREAACSSAYFSYKLDVQGIFPILFYSDGLVYVLS